MRVWKGSWSPKAGQQGKFDLSADPAFQGRCWCAGFESGKSTHANRLATIKDTYERFGDMIDTHVHRRRR